MDPLTITFIAAIIIAAGVVVWACGRNRALSAKLRTAQADKKYWRQNNIALIETNRNFRAQLANATRRADLAEEHADHWHSLAEQNFDDAANLISRAEFAEAQLATLQAADTERRAKLSEWGRKGALVSNMKWKRVDPAISKREE